MYGETFTSRGQRRAEVIFSHLLHEELLSWWCCSSSTVTLIWNKVQQCLMKERKQRSAAGCYGVNVCTEMLSSAQAVHPQQKHSKWHQTTRYFTSPKKVLLKDDKWVECEVRHSGCRHRQEMVKNKTKTNKQTFSKHFGFVWFVFFLPPLLKTTAVLVVRSMISMCFFCLTDNMVESRGLFSENEQWAWTGDDCRCWPKLATAAAVV